MAAAPMADKIEIVSFPLLKRDKSTAVVYTQTCADNEMAMSSIGPSEMRKRWKIHPCLMEKSQIQQSNSAQHL